MGNTVVLFLFIFTFPQLGQAADPFLGCQYFCKSQFPDNPRAYDNCLVQTQIEKFCGKKPGAAKNVPVPEPRPQQDSGGAGGSGSVCKTRFDELREKCELTTSDAAGSCDEENNVSIKNSSTNAQNTTKGSSDAVQQACGQSGEISNSAKSAMTDYRNNCAGALGTCKEACSELKEFLRDNTCWSELGFSANSSQEFAESKMNSCESFQSQVDDADQSISNYQNTASGSEACQMASMGTPSAEEASKESEKPKTFCEMNPAYPGCASKSADCNDPSQANNKVCVCSRNPNNPLCSGGSQSAGNSSLGSSAIDSESRLPSSQADLGMGNSPDIPTLSHAKLPGAGGGEAIDGRQGGASVGSSTVGSGSTPGLGGGGNSEEGDPQVPGKSGTYGGSGGAGSAYGAGGGGSADGSAAGRASSRNGLNHVYGNPDLRQFLPGGLQDPKLRMQGNSGVGHDGITGPHSSNWLKIQNRFQILRHTLEP